MDGLERSLQALRGLRVLVTGHTGFKGSWLAYWLQQIGAEVLGISKDIPTNPSHFEVLRLEELIHHQIGDLRDEVCVSKLVKAFCPEVVFHLAAQATVRTSYSSPKETFDTNVGGAVNLLEAIRASTSVRALVFITSDKCYRNIETHRGYVEDDPLGGRDPYSCSKAAAEHVFSAYLHSYFANNKLLGAASTRAGNVIGGGDWAADRLLPDCVRSLRQGEAIEIRSPNATRPWQHVLEPLSGYLMLAAALLDDPAAFSGSWNFGPPATMSESVSSVVRKSIAVWGSGSHTIVNPEPHLHESTLLHLNATKAQQQLGWRTRWSFQPMMERTVGWYKSWTNGSSPRDLTATDIQEYVRTTS